MKQPNNYIKGKLLYRYPLSILDRLFLSKSTLWVLDRQFVSISAEIGILDRLLQYIPMRKNIASLLRIPKLGTTQDQRSPYFPA